jgi:hypothetical protein
MYVAGFVDSVGDGKYLLAVDQLIGGRPYYHHEEE